MVGRTKIIGDAYVKAPTVPKNEEERRAALHSYRVLDSEPETGFDDLTALAARMLGVPIVLVSLIDETRQWFKSKYGLDVPETPREFSFCGHVVADGRALIVENALTDERFHDNPFVMGEPFISSYAGVPLVSPAGYILGTLCAIDHRARVFSAMQIDTLEILARQVCTQLELRRQLLEAKQRTTEPTNALAELAATEAKLKAKRGTTTSVVATVERDGMIVYANAALERFLGYEPSALVGQAVKTLVAAPHRADLIEEWLVRSNEKSSFGTVTDYETVAQRKDGSNVPIEVTVRELKLGERRMFTGFVRDITEVKRTAKLNAEFMELVNREVRGPMASIRASLDMLATERIGDLSAKAADVVDIARTNSERLTRRFKAMLAVERTMSRPAKFKQNPTSLRSLVGGAVEANRSLACERDVSCRWDTNAADAQVIVDPDHMAEILEDLVSNAIITSSQGASVQVELQKKKAIARVTICDRNGSLAADLRKQLFEHIERTDTGIGLRMAKAFVERWGGKIGYDALPGGGRLLLDQPSNRICRRLNTRFDSTRIRGPHFPKRNHAHDRIGYAKSDAGDGVDQSAERGWSGGDPGRGDMQRGRYARHRNPQGFGAVACASEHVEVTQDQQKHGHREEMKVGDLEQLAAWHGFGCADGIGFGRKFDLRTIGIGSSIGNRSFTAVVGVHVA